MLTPADLAAHAKLGITEAILLAARVDRVDDLDARALLSTNRSGDLSGIVFPYRHPITGRIVTRRLRRDHPDMENGKPTGKYISAYGDRSHLYFPPACNGRLSDVTVRLFLVEAEKSVLSLASAGAFAIGTGGCWGWRGVIGKTEDANGARLQKGPLPDLSHVTWTGRSVVIAFDSNTATNAKVQTARRMLAKELRKRGAHVLILDVPAEPGINGPDDYIGRHGADAFFALVDDAGDEISTDAFPTTETGDAECFADRTGARVRYDHLAKRWLLFRDHWWAEQTTGDVHRLALDTVRDRQRAAIGDKGRLRWATDGEKRSRLVNLLALAENILPLADDGEHWDADPDLLGVQNGVINLRTGILRGGHPDDRITLVSPLAYDPQASTVKWTQFVLDICNEDKKLAAYFQVVFGYALTGLTREQCFWIFYGLGSNGKSTLLEIFTKYVIPRQSWTMKFPSTKWSESMSDYQRAQLVGRRLIVSKENERTQRLNTEFIKSLTGNEEIEARHPYGRPFNFSPVSKFILAVNHKPIILDETHAMWRRVRMVPFLRTFQLNPAFADSLIAEAPSVLAWAVEGAGRYYREGITTPRMILDATTEYQRESDQLASFFDARCVLDADKKVKVRAQHLFNALRDFYDKRQTPGDERLSQKELGQRIANDARFDVRHGDGDERLKVFYHGVGLLETKQEEMETKQEERDSPF